MTVWVLILTFTTLQLTGTDSYIAVAGIETETECHALAAKIAPPRTIHKCFSYKAAYH